MKNKRKYVVTSISICGILFGRILNRILSSYFGNNSSNIVFSVSAVVVLCAILISIAMGYYKGAVQLVIISIPMIIGGIGLYLNNMDFVGLGILSTFIIYPIIIKIAQKLKRDR